MMRRTSILVCGLLIAAAHCRAGERPSMDLSGEWEFKLDPRDVGHTERWFEPGMRFDRRIHVPGAWNAQGVEFGTDLELLAYDKGRLEEQKELNSRRILGVERESQRLFHTYPGPAWYRKQVTIPAQWTGKTVWLVFNGVHRSAEVWVNGKPAGAHQSYLTPFRIEISRPDIGARPGDTIDVRARVDGRRDRAVDPLMGCLDTLDFLYVNWGGIHQPVRLEATPGTRIDDVFVVPRLADSTAQIRVNIAGPETDGVVVAAEILEATGATVATVKKVGEGGGAETVLAARISNAKLWSPRSPHLYTARVRLIDNGTVIDERAVRFGMREFQVSGGKFLLNGEPIFLRGYGDDCIFPNTICPPVDKEELRARLARAREYGFNYVRHHSWTPPEAYLEAADELGMMLQSEFPFAYRWDLPTTPETKRAALEQWRAMIRLNRNHPSIVTWCMGNELYDSFEFAPEMYEAAKRLDPTRPVVDSDGCRFEHAGRETLDYLVVQFGEGNSLGHEDRKYDFPEAINKPVIAHEMGYFVTLHDLAQIDLFRNGLRPYWLLQTRELATTNGVLDVYPEWLAASYRLQATCLKSNMEAARRSRLSGTSVWLFQDYPNCAEGVVGMFGQEKGLSAEEFRRFNAPTVLLLDIPRRNWWGGERADIRFVVSRFEDEPSESATLRWQLTDGSRTIAEGSRPALAIRSGKVQELHKLPLELPNLDRAAKLTLRAELADANGEIENSWNLWVYPRDLLADTGGKIRAADFDPVRTLYSDAAEAASGAVPTNVTLLVTTRLNENIVEYLEGGGRVLLADPAAAFTVEATNYRLSSWDGGGPSGTIVNTVHPALRAMPTDDWCDLQFYHLIQDSKTALLAGPSKDLAPIVRCIDRPTRLANRAYLFEATLRRGKLLVSGFNFSRAVESGDPAGIFLLDQLVRYALGNEFRPTASISADALRMKVEQ